MHYLIRMRFVALLLLSVVVVPAYALPDFDDSAPLPPFMNPCLGHLTRFTSALIIMAQDTQEFLLETDTDPVTTYSPYFPQYGNNGCTRRVIEIRVPSTTSSGCETCYDLAEVQACAGSFPGNKIFEEICHVPSESTPEATCKTFNHKIEIFKRPVGAASYGVTPLKTWVFKGYINSNGKCKVGHKVGSLYLDSAEIYATIAPPASGTDRYRILRYPVYNGNVLSTSLRVGFESGMSR